jgi:hypothetical protein
LASLSYNLRKKLTHHSIFPGRGQAVRKVPQGFVFSVIALFAGKGINSIQLLYKEKK